jgi:hypothetical protein
MPHLNVSKRHLKIAKIPDFIGYFCQVTALITARLRVAYSALALRASGTVQ